MKTPESVAESSLHLCIAKLEGVTGELHFLTHSKTKTVFRETSLAELSHYKEELDRIILELEELSDRVRLVKRVKRSRDGTEVSE